MSHMQKNKGVERNDPLLTNAVLIEGLSGAVACARRRSFHLDFSQYITIVKASYSARIGADRGLRKFISPSMYQYYCVILLWKRLRFVLTESGNGYMEYDNLDGMFPKLSIPEEIGLYLDGIGNIRDYCGVDYDFKLQGELCRTQFDGMTGSFGRIDANSHFIYETLPAPIVSLYRILYDMAIYIGQTHPQPITVDEGWNLPIDLRPEIAGICVNRNLLGWDLALALTTEQYQTCSSAGLSVNFKEGVPIFETMGIVNRSGIPVLRPLLESVCYLLASSKSLNNTHAESSSTKGSLAQVGFIIRHEGFRQAGRQLKPICDGTAMFYAKPSKYICSAASLFRYRIKRKVDGYNDSHCYTFTNGDALDGWSETEDMVFNSAPFWNMSHYHSVMTNGTAVSFSYVHGISQK